jgi:hypothetical protein
MNNNGMNFFQNSGYRNDGNKKRTLILDLDDTDNTHLGKASKFNIKLREPFIIDKPSEIYLDNFLTFNANLGDTHNHAAFVLKIDEFNINNGVASNLSGDKLSGAILIPNANNSVNNFFTTVAHKTKKFNYICDINPTKLHSINGQISDLGGNSIFHGINPNNNNIIYAITGITTWTATGATAPGPLNINDEDVTVEIGGSGAQIVTILASVEVNGEAIYFSTSYSGFTEGSIGSTVTIRKTDPVLSFTVSSSSGSLNLQKDNGRFIAEFTIISKE